MGKLINLYSEKLYQIKIVLDDVKPIIWRRFLLPVDYNLLQLHKIIQTVMGWTNSHLHQFRIADKIYSVPFEEEPDDFLDSAKYLVKDFIKRQGQTFFYDYDFGDGWEHTLTFEKEIENRNKILYPECIAGNRNCPPEDCGGPYGYMNMLKDLKKKDSENYRELIEWLGDEPDPEYFNLEEINALLRSNNFGCLEILDD